MRCYPRSGCQELPYSIGASRKGPAEESRTVILSSAWINECGVLLQEDGLEMSGC